MIRGRLRFSLIDKDGRPGAAAHALLYLLGALHWAAFLDFGGIPFGLLDWAQEHFFYSIQKEAAVSGVLPLHISIPFLGTDRFLAIPLVVLLPHVPLLRWLSISSFVLLHVMIFYSAGYLGTAALARRTGMRWPGFLAFYLLFNFNGYPTSHLAVGHTVWWTGYFLLPFFFVHVFEWLERGPSVRTSLLAALVIFLMSASGSFHLCTWCVIFVGLLGLRRPAWLRFSALTVAAAAAFVAYRVVPGALAFRTLRHGYPSGYPGPGALADALTVMKSAAAPTVNGMGWWEYDMYVGMIGAALLFGFGVVPFLFRKLIPGDPAGLRRLDLPIAGTAVLACGEVYWWAFSSLPVLGAERVVTRMLVVSVVALSALSAVRLDALVKAVRPARAISFLTAGVLLFLAADLARHSWLWRVANLRLIVPHPSAPGPVPLIANRPDDPYAWALLAGGTVTVAALLGALSLVLRRGSGNSRRRR